MKDVLVILNNYFHDVATAVLLASAVILWVLERHAQSSPEGLAALRQSYPALTRFARVALAWIVIGGIPRTIFFTRYEWDPAVVKGIVPALIVKHALMVAAVVAGAVMWRRVARRVKAEPEVSNPCD
ncbi:hypothetical protein MX659_06220 [Coriobacteriia bacterium Es71-Z0120]|uniref:hypothetical protein n=1 Tax=Parvivirga hydrogeniphila TaxID=2939460 RepID=UPI002260F938|nr:hypothetical protein [Parvivirga hydrogeniphila]MCL4079180.1 hypothetical protein [Parvivirga hydrogeniphila]